MRQVKMMLMVLIFFSNCGWAQTNVQIGELYYSISGTSATVIRPNMEDNDYTNDTYIIPSSITYNGYDYVVNKIGRLAFSGGFYYDGSSASIIELPNTINLIDEYAFR